MRIPVLSLLILLLSIVLKAQEQPGSLDDNDLWVEGSISLNDGTQIKGPIWYNDRDGFVAFNDGGNKKIFTPNSVSRFGFYDAQQKRQRIFLTFPFADPATGGERLQIFEVLREYADFAILFKKDPIKARKRKFGAASDFVIVGASQIARSPEVSQVESILLMSADGVINPYIQVKHHEDGITSEATTKDWKTKKKVVDEDFLAEYITEPVYEKLKEYATENDLKFKIIEDFLRILDYYDTIRK